MKKIPSLFKRDYDGNRQVYDEIVEGSEWVRDGEGIATIKLDGTACLIRDGVCYKRYDRKWDRKRKKYREAPEGWEPCEEQPNKHTGHWPGWVVIGNGPEDQWHREAFAKFVDVGGQTNGTYELVGPKVQGNPYKLEAHFLIPHDNPFLEDREPPRDFDGLRKWCEGHLQHEGIVWHHEDGRMVKIKRKDFGLPWPVKT